MSHPAFIWKKDDNHPDKGQWTLSEYLYSASEYRFNLLLNNVKKPQQRGSVKKPASEPLFPGANMADTRRAVANTAIDTANTVSDGYRKRELAEYAERYPQLNSGVSENPMEIDKLKYDNEAYGEFAGTIAGAIGMVGTKKPPKSLMSGGDTTLTKFSNKYPTHEIGIPKIIPLDKLKNINGKFNYIVKEDGKLIVGREFNTPGGGHIDLANGETVISAGQVKVVNGEIKYIDNASGHYQPKGDGAQTMAKRAFKQLGFDVDNKFVEKQWVSDPKLKNGGAWRPLVNE